MREPLRRGEEERKKEADGKTSPTPHFPNPELLLNAIRERCVRMYSAATVGGESHECVCVCVEEMVAVSPSPPPRLT